MVDILDKDLCGKLRDVVNSTNLFYEDADERKIYSPICAMMDRVDESMEYIFSHSDIPANKNELILVLHHISIVVGAVKELFIKLGLDYNFIERGLPRYLQDICKQEPFYLALEQIPSDDTVFEYVRSISFAHPLNTSRAHLAKQIKADHCSPFLLLDEVACGKNCFGICVYSTLSNDVFHIKIPYDALIAYVYERFNLISYIINALKKKIENKEKLWKERKVKRDGTPTEVLQDILSIQEERYERTYEVRSLISIFTSPCTLQENQESLNKLRKAIVDIIPALCDATDNMDSEQFYSLSDKIIDVYPKKTYGMFFYHMEKIFAYLDTDVHLSDKSWGLQQAEEFSKEFAKKWVKIDINTMDDEEIKVLVMAACYLEAQEQEREANDRKN